VQFIPREYQKYAVQRALSDPFLGLFLEPGLGKTAITLSAIKELIQNRFEVSRVLVVAPPMVAKTVWKEEAEKWDDFKSLRVVKVLGSPLERAMALRETADVYVTSITVLYSVMCWCRDNIGRWPFDMVVIDELSKFKDAGTQAFKTAKEIRRRPGLKRLVGLTGTPLTNNLEEMWSQMWLLDQGERLGKTVTLFRYDYMIPGARKGYVVYDWAPKPGALEQVKDKVSDICVSMRKEDWLQLPEALYITREVVLTEDARKQYKRVVQDAYTELGDGGVITAATAGVVVGKLQQIANGIVYDSERETHWVHSEKEQQLRAIIEETVDIGENIIVYYAYQHDLDAILYATKDYKTRVLRGKEAVEAWNAGEVQILLAHPDSAGHGLNLQTGGHVIVWYGLTYSLDKYIQANARLHRSGQELPVRIYHIVAKHTVDERIMARLAAREEGFNFMMDALKAEIDEMEE